MLRTSFNDNNIPIESPYITNLQLFIIELMLKLAYNRAMLLGFDVAKTGDARIGFIG